MELISCFVDMQIVNYMQHIRPRYGSGQEREMALYSIWQQRSIESQHVRDISVLEKPTAWRSNIAHCRREFNLWLISGPQ